MRLFVFSIIFFTFFLQGTSPAFAGKEELLEKALFKADWLFEKLQEINHVPGMSLAIGVEGDVVFAKGYGHADVQNQVPVTAETKFRYASVSKLFAATAAAQLYEKGLLDIDADVRTYVPEFPDKGFAITTRQLAAHISGITHYQAVDFNRGKTHYDSVMDALNIFKNRNLLFEPGTAYEYSSYGYTLLSAVIERASGQDYLSYLKDHILDPAGITGVVGENMHVDIPDLTVMYERDGVDITPEPILDFSYIYAGGGLDGTPTDLVKLAIGYWRGTLIAPATQIKIFTPVKTTTGGRTGRNTYEVGFGWRIDTDLHGRAIVHHSGVTPGARAILLSYQDPGVHIAFTSNATWTSSTERTATTLVFGVLQAFDEVKVEASCPVGDYTWDGTFNGAEAHGVLAIQESDGLCQGTISMPRAFAGWVEGFNAPVPENLPLLLIGSNGEAGIFGLVTPLGIFETQVVSKDGILTGSATIGSSRVFEFTAHQ